MRMRHRAILVAAIVFLLTGGAQRICGQACQNMPVEIQVAATSHQNLGGIEPANLVALGTRVRLFGVAQSQSLTPQCVLIKNPLPFSWTLRFQAPGKATAFPPLFNSDTLQPEFNADEKGAYTAELQAGGKTEFVRVETIEPMGWFSIGPNGHLDGDHYVGRVNTLAFDPARGMLYAGTALGGVFRWPDFGETWTPMTDHKGLPTAGIGALAVGIDGDIYAATGDSHWNNRAFPPPGGAGIWKSTDQGVTWNPAGTTVGGNCPNGNIALTGNVTRIVTHPKTAGLLYVAGAQGILRSLDGGACWQRIFNDRSTDIAMDPSAPATIYIATPGQQSVLWKTTNGEDPKPVFQPLPIPLNDNYSYALLAVAPSAPKTVYAALATNGRTDFLRTDSAGESWSQGPSEVGCANQCAYDMALAVSPIDADRVVYGSQAPMQSITGMRAPGAA